MTSQGEDKVLPPHDYRFKIVLVGDPGVGKTSLLLRYTEDNFPDTEVMNVGVDYKSKCIEVNGKTAYLEIWDTAGQERFRTISASYYKGAHGILLVYDIMDEETFANLNSWFSEIDRNVCDDKGTKRILVGNKVDCGASRNIQKSAASDLAQKVEMDYQETSAKEDTNVNELFLSLVQGLVEAGVDGKGSRSGDTIQITSTRRTSSNSSSGKCCGGKS